MKEINLIKYLKEILDNPKLMFILLLVTSFLLFLPSTILDRLKLDTLFTRMQWIHPAIGILWILSLVALIIFLVSWIYQLHLKARKRKRALSQLKSLSADEIAIFIECIESHTQTIILQIDDSAAVSLVNKGLLSKSYGCINILKYPYLIPDFVWNHLVPQKEDVEHVFNIDKIKLSEVEAALASRARDRRLRHWRR